MKIYLHSLLPPGTSSGCSSLLNMCVSYLAVKALAKNRASYLPTPRWCWIHDSHHTIIPSDDKVIMADAETFEDLAAPTSMVRLTWDLWRALSESKQPLCMQYSETGWVQCAIRSGSHTVTSITTPGRKKRLRAVSPAVLVCAAHRVEQANRPGSIFLRSFHVAACKVHNV